MFRKVAFGIISVLIKPYGVDIQTYCGILVLITAFIYNATARPFLNDDLDDLENAALFTSFLTLYGGLYLFSSNSSQGLKMFCTLGIIVLNIGFAAFVIKTSSCSSSNQTHLKTLKLANLITFELDNDCTTG